MCVAFLNVSCWNETFYVTYDTIEEARADGAFRRGWLPEWLPEDAHTIHETHDLDTNVLAFSFSVLNADAFIWPPQCNPSDNFKGGYMRTKLFPKNLYELPNGKNCDGVFVVMDRQGVIHGSANGTGLKF